jgi:small subunit ribosomal protein S8
MLTDPTADLLTRIRNANRARKERVEVPWSRLKERIVQVMEAEGFLGGVKVVGEGLAKRLQLALRYDAHRTPVISGLARVSKPSLRVHVGVEEIPMVRRGLGISILSTSRGVIVDREARRQGVGGEVLCAVW